MTIEEIREGAPPKANGYEVSNGNVFYFIDDFFIWTGEKWSMVIFNEGYIPDIKPL